MCRTVVEHVDRTPIHERPRSQKKWNFPATIQNVKACSGFPESPIQGAVRRHPVIHMNREQYFLSKVTQFSQNSVYLRCATCLPKTITNDKAFKFTAALGGSHADNRGASHSEAYGVMWTNKQTERRSNIYRFALLRLLARLRGYISEWRHPKTTYLQVWQCVSGWQEQLLFLNDSMARTGKTEDSNEFKRVPSRPPVRALHRLACRAFHTFLWFQRVGTHANPAPFTSNERLHAWLYNLHF